MISIEVKSGTAFHWKACRWDEYEPRGLSCGSAFNIFQDILKSDNLLDKQGFVDSQTKILSLKQLKDCKINLLFRKDRY